MSDLVVVSVHRIINIGQSAFGRQGRDGMDYSLVFRTKPAMLFPNEVSVVVTDPFDSQRWLVVLTSLKIRRNIRLIEGYHCHNFVSYFGHPSGGFFFCSDFLTARFQSPDSLSISGFGPVLAVGLPGGDPTFRFRFIAIIALL